MPIHNLEDVRVEDARADAIVYCEGHFGGMDGKTANGLVRHSGKYRIVAVIDSRHVGRDAGKVLGGVANGIPVCRDLSHALEHDAKTRENSGLQGFDRSRMSTNQSGFKRDRKGFVSEFRLKTTDQVVHERMAERPFLTFKAFDTATFVNMGVKSFDSHNDGCNGHEAGGACDELAAAQARARAGKQRLNPGRGLPRIPVARPAQPARMPIRPAGR